MPSLLIDFSLLTFFTTLKLDFKKNKTKYKYMITIQQYLHITSFSINLSSNLHGRSSSRPAKFPECLRERRCPFFTLLNLLPILFSLFFVRVNIAHPFALMAFWPIASLPMILAFWRTLCLLSVQLKDCISFGCALRKTIDLRICHYL